MLSTQAMLENWNYTAFSPLVETIPVSVFNAAKQALGVTGRSSENLDRRLIRRGVYSGDDCTLKNVDVQKLEPEKAVDGMMLIAFQKPTIK